MEHVLVERDFEEPTAFDSFRGARDADPGCFDRYRVNHLGSFVASDQRRMLCHAMAPDAEAVRTVSDLHHLPYSRIWTADVRAADDYGGEPAPGALTTRDGARDARPHRQVVVVRATSAGRVEGQALACAASELLGPAARHLFSYSRRGGGVFIAIFDHPAPKPLSHGGLLAWPAVARLRKDRG